MNKKIAMGCGIGCLGIVLIGGIATYLLVPKMLEWGEKQLEEELHRKSVASDWNPPKEATLENFFPQTVGDYDLRVKDDQAAIPELTLDSKGWHASYQSGGSKIDVFVYQATQSEKEAMFGRIDDVYEQQNGGFKTKTMLGYRMYYWSSAHHQNHFWWTKDWLFIFRTTDSPDRDPFVFDFLNASSDKKPAN